MSSPNDASNPQLEELEKSLSIQPNSWETRKQLAQAQYNNGEYLRAANTIWGAPEIPPVDIEIAFAARTLAKGKPRRALRLLHAVLEQNAGKPVKNLAIANALLHHGLAVEAARFYGAATAVDPSLMDPEFEYWLMWVDDQCKLWGEWASQELRLEDLPWVKRNGSEIIDMANRKPFTLTTPVRIPGLAQSAAESLADIEHVHHGHRATPLSPPSIQFNESALQALGTDTPVPGQRQEGQLAPPSRSVGLAPNPGAPVPLTPQPTRPGNAPANPANPTAPVILPSKAAIPGSPPAAPSVKSPFNLPKP